MSATKRRERKAAAILRDQHPDTARLEWRYVLREDKSETGLPYPEAMARQQYEYMKARPDDYPFVGLQYRTAPGPWLDAARNAGKEPEAIRPQQNTRTKESLK